MRSTSSPCNCSERSIPDFFHFRDENFLTSSVMIVSPVSGNRLRAHNQRFERSHQRGNPGLFFVGAAGHSKLTDRLERFDWERCQLGPDLLPMHIPVEQRLDLDTKRDEVIPQDSLWQDRPKQSTHNSPDPGSEHQAKRSIDDGLRRDRLLWVESDKRADRQVTNLHPEVDAWDARRKEPEGNQHQEQPQVHDGIVGQKRRGEQKQYGVDRKKQRSAKGRLKRSQITAATSL